MIKQYGHYYFDISDVIAIETRPKDIYRIYLKGAILLILTDDAARKCFVDFLDSERER